MLKADAYASLLCGQPPNIHCEELDVSLSSTFALSNSNGLGVTYERTLQEPTGRAYCKLFAITSNFEQSMPCVLLVEDIQIGLCGALRSVWKHNRLCRSGVMGLHPTVDITESISSQLDAWKMELDKILVQCTRQSKQESHGLPLRAYVGFEDESDPGWNTIALGRVKALTTETAILYHLLSLHLYISRHAKLAEFLLPNPGGASIRPPPGDDWVSRWKQSKDARKALAHAVAVTRTLESALLGTKDSSLPSPITALAFLISRSVLTIWGASLEGTCTCNVEEEHIDIDLNSEGLYRGWELQGWFENGGPAKVNGNPLCKCAGELWFLRLEALLF
ncbi:hypothetical protein DL764_004767 [Monosporascus ibericus]|uniref:Transcription factor domain-containing protein n=1 Tax=Monosporascus ibericus TaxID=155417 RepID=A0A4Q4TF92_9PEZI|nr:hypothetical protein DL764_004767 [Monosporascus ibericus]